MRKPSDLRLNVSNRNPPMAKSQLEHPWILDAVPLLVVILIAFHVFALVYWIYRLATDTKPQQQLQQQRRKAH